MMRGINWRYGGLLLATAGMETSWIVGCSRVLLRHPGSDTVGLLWWSALILFIMALVTARTLGRLELRHGAWIIGGIAFFTSALLLPSDLGWTTQALGQPGGPSTTTFVLTLLLGFLIWFRAFQVPMRAGDSRATIRQFQLGVLILVGLMLVALRLPAPMADLVVAYFGFGLLATALTIIEEIAWSEAGDVTPFNLKWAVTLVGAITVAGATTWLATQVITVATVRWLLRPIVILVNIVFFILAMIVSTIVMQILPLLQWLFRDLKRQDVQKTVDNLFPEIIPPEQENVPPINPEIAKIFEISLVVVLILVVLWIVVRAFRRWQVRQYATPGGVRETVVPEGSLAEDLAGFLKDRWQRLRELADLRRLLQRWGSGSARAIYASLLALLAAADHPRQPEQTPYEYEPVAGEALPTCQTEIQDITEAYVRAHYGEVEIGTEELVHLQEAWKRITKEGKELLRARSQKAA